MINSNVVLSQDDEYPKMDQRAFFVSIGENDDRPWDGNCVHHSQLCAQAICVSKMQW